MNEYGLKQHKVGVIGVVGMIYAMTAAGAYGIEDMVSSSGPGMTIVMLFVLPLIWAFPIALASSELGSAIPDECGFYRWVQRALGEFWGFQIGWLKNVGIYINVAVFVVLATDYLASYIGMNNLQSYICKVVIIGIFTWINLRGVKDVAIVSSVISAAILLAFAVIAVIGFMNMSHNPFEPVVATGQTVVGSIGSSIAIGMWMYAGYESMSSLAGELKNPQVIPKAIMIALPLIIGTYVLPTIAAVGSVGRWEEWGSDGVSYVNVAMEFAPAFGVAFVMVAFISNISMFNVYLASGARGFFVMAEDNLAPKSLVKCGKRRGVPYVAVLSLLAVCLVLCAFKFDILVTVVSLFNMGLYSLIMISQIVLRRKEPELPRPYRIKMGKTGTDIFCAVPVLVAFIALYINGADYFVLGLLGMMTG
ncbi:MAG: APC family permease, partial [Anaerovoracaceae bacterium]